MVFLRAKKNACSALYAMRLVTGHTGQKGQGTAETLNNK
jgi:hypothetical protein